MKQNHFFEKTGLRNVRTYISDLFKCSKCGHTAYLKVLGNTATCSECGGTMYRQ